MAKQIISTDQAPAAIGPYSQGVVINNVLHTSGQIPLDPQTMEFVGDDIESQTHRVFKSLQAIAEAANTSLDQTVKLNIFLSDLENFAAVNDIMKQYFVEPYPARATLQVARLPKDALVEMDAVIAID